MPRMVSLALSKGISTSANLRPSSVKIFILEYVVSVGPVSSRSTCRYKMMAGAPGASGSLVIASSCGDTGSQSSARTALWPPHNTSTANAPCTDLRLNTGVNGPIYFLLCSVLAIPAVAASMAEAPGIVEIRCRPRASATIPGMNDDTLELVQTKIAFLERTAAELSDVVFKQHLEIQALEAKLKSLADRLSGAQSDEGPRPPEQERPPHY